MKPVQQRSALLLSTLAFAIAFAVWGMIAPLAKEFQTNLHLSEHQVWLLIATPVLLGSLMRLPLGMLTDRLGGRLVFGTLLVLLAVPSFMLTVSTTYNEILFWALVLGTAGASFAVGIAFTSAWFEPQRQGMALGVYGAGNIGQSIALFAVPLLTHAMGSWQLTYRLFGLVSFVYGVIFLLTARNAPVTRKPKSFVEMLKVLGSRPLSWLLSLFYFVTFGGFVALSIGLPKLLQGMFNLGQQDAGLRVAGFVVLATFMRPLGGYLSDLFGGAKMLMVVFAMSALFALGLTSRALVPFSIGALGIATFVGLGNGCVFKLVPQYFAADTAVVTGLVGAMGGLGGFFPPLVLGAVKGWTGSYAPGFIMLSMFCVLCLILNYLFLVRTSSSTHSLVASP